MATRTGYVGTESVGDILTVANFNKLPGGLIGYANVTSTQSTITSAVDLTSFTLTVTVGTSRIIRVAWHVPVQQGTNNDGFIVTLLESSTQLGSGAQTMTSNAVGVTIDGYVILSPSAGSHTYKLQGAQLVGGTCATTCSATNPGSLIVEDLGVAF